MKSPLRVAPVLALLCFVQTAGFAASKPVELKWSELAPLIQSRRVELTLVDGAKLRGEAIVVREDSIVMAKTSVPRESVSLIKVEKSRGSWARKLGTVIGALSGIVIGGYVSAVSTDSAAGWVPIFLGISSAGTLGGYYVGRGIDNGTTLIKIIP
jgi:hypothetical protein